MGKIYDLIVSNINDGGTFKRNSSLLKEQQSPLILFGAGKNAVHVLRGLKDAGIKPDFFCDNNPQKQGKTFNGLPVISYELLLEKFNNSVVIIATLDAKKEIAEQLIKDGLFYFESDVTYLLAMFKEEYEKAYSLFDEELSREIFHNRIMYSITMNPKWLIPFKSIHLQYFDEEIINLSDNEIFIDGGAFTGDTLEAFIKRTNGKFNKIYAFEPEESKHKEFDKFSLNNNKMQLLPYGLWHENAVLNFDARNTAGSMLSDDGNIKVNVTSIDKVLNNKTATFIKLDIQGAELEALKGAKMTIEKYKPKLAICVYHKPLDIINIPKYLKSIVPEYKLYLRHYGESIYETVLYAVTD